MQELDGLLHLAPLSCSNHAVYSVRIACVLSNCFYADSTICRNGRVKPFSEVCPVATVLYNRTSKNQERKEQEHMPDTNDKCNQLRKLHARIEEELRQLKEEEREEEE